MQLSNQKSFYFVYRNKSRLILMMQKCCVYNLSYLCDSKMQRKKFTPTFHTTSRKHLHIALSIRNEVCENCTY